METLPFDLPGLGATAGPFVRSRVTPDDSSQVIDFADILDSQRSKAVNLADISGGFGRESVTGTKYTDYTHYAPAIAEEAPADASALIPLANLLAALPPAIPGVPSGTAPSTPQAVTPALSVASEPSQSSPLAFMAAQTPLTAPAPEPVSSTHSRIEDGIAISIPKHRDIADNASATGRGPLPVMGRDVTLPAPPNRPASVGRTPLRQNEGIEANRPHVNGPSQPLVMAPSRSTMQDDELPVGAMSTGTMTGTDMPVAMGQTNPQETAGSPAATIPLANPASPPSTALASPAGSPFTTPSGPAQPLAPAQISAPQAYSQPGMATRLHTSAGNEPPAMAPALRVMDEPRTANAGDARPQFAVASTPAAASSGAASVPAVEITQKSHDPSRVRDVNEVSSAVSPAVSPAVSFNPPEPIQTSRAALSGRDTNEAPASPLPAVSINVPLTRDLRPGEPAAQGLNPFMQATVPHRDSRAAAEANTPYASTLPKRSEVIDGAEPATTLMPREARETLPSGHLPTNTAAPVIEPRHQPGPVATSSPLLVQTHAQTTETAALPVTQRETPVPDPTTLITAQPAIGAVTDTPVPTGVIPVTAPPPTQIVENAAPPSPYSAPAAHIYVETPVHAPVWSNALGERVLWLMENGQHKAKLHINPEHLGPIDVTLTLKGNEVGIAFTTAQPEVRSALDLALPQLRETLTQGGVALGNTTVSADTQGSGQQGSGPAPRQRVFMPPTLPGDTASNTPQGVPARPERTSRGLLDTYA